MKKVRYTFITSLAIALSVITTRGSDLKNTQMQGKTFIVKIDKPENGSLKLNPALPADGKVEAGTVITVTAIPNEGYGFDSGYFSAPGIWGTMYYESMTPVFKVTIDQDESIGASFIEKEKLQGYTVTQDVEYAQPGVKKLNYDVFTPDGAKNLPCIVIIHGGGWITHTEDIMRGLARELVKGGDYVVFSINYRWAGKLDGDSKANDMADMIGDVYGALAHIQEHAAEYGGDPNRIAVTGDSAGGHLSAAAANMTTQIGDGGFGIKEGVFEIMPSYLPKGKSVKQVSQDLTEAIQAAAPSYGVFAAADLKHYSENPAADDSWKEAIAPINFIPNAKGRLVPQFLLRGVDDGVIKDEMVRSYANALTEAGQRAEYIQIEGIGHGFFDWKPNKEVKAVFAKFGVPYASKMKAFFDTVFYPVK